MHKSHGNYTGQGTLGKRLIAEKPHGIKIFFESAQGGPKSNEALKKIILKKQRVMSMGLIRPPCCTRIENGTLGVVPFVLTGSSRMC